MKKLIDIGANLTDKVFCGIYRGIQRHENDFTTVLNRAFHAGLEKIIVTSGSLSDSEEAIELCKLDDSLFCTVGCHPTRCQEISADPPYYLSRLKTLIKDNPSKVVAVGECGLDYDREQFCSRDVQQKYFYEQLRLAFEVNLPLFLHCRAAHEDLFEFLQKANVEFSGTQFLRGVVHTFDGSLEDAVRFIEFGLYIGLNGCSLKTENNLKVVKSLPLDRILLETDAPWCEVRPTHAGFKYARTHHVSRKCDRWNSNCMVKGRNEPANIVQVLEIVAALKEVSEEELSQQVYENTNRLFSFSMG